MIPVATVMYRSFYDVQEYRLRMQQRAGLGPEELDDFSRTPSPGSLIASLSSRLRAAITAAFSLKAAMPRHVVPPVPDRWNTGAGVT
jgi:hypothetical protein